MADFLKYLQAVFVERWWIYIAFLPEFIDFISAYFFKDFSINIPFQVTLIIFFVLWQIANYKAWQELFNPSNRPRVIIDYDLDSFNVCYLVIKNIGNDHARELNIRFDPDIRLIENDRTTLNNKPFLKKIDFLTINSSIRFFFGSLLGSEKENSTLRRFTIYFSYKDSRLKRSFVETQIIDSRQFLESTPKSPPHTYIVKELKDIGKNIKELTRSLERSKNASNS